MTDYMTSAASISANTQMLTNVPYTTLQKFDAILGSEFIEAEIRAELEAEYKAKKLENLPAEIPDEEIDELLGGE